MHHSRAVSYPALAIVGAVLLATGASQVTPPSELPARRIESLSPLYRPAAPPTETSDVTPDPNRRGPRREAAPVERPNLRQYIEATYTRPDEIVAMRDAYSRHFRNPDGTVTALISPSPIHYRAGDAWETIDLEIHDLRNETSMLRSYYPPTADGPTRIEGLTWTPVKLEYTNGFGAEVLIAEPEPVAAQVDGNVVAYPGIFPGATDRFEVGSALVKHDLVLDAAPAAPPYAGMSLDVVGIVTLDAGLRFDGNWIVDGDGTRLYRLAPPYAGEVNGRAKVVSRYAIREIGEDVYELRIQTPADWLLDPARQYPVRIDPTIWSADGVRVDNSYDYSGALCIDNGTTWSSWGDVESGLNWADPGWGGNFWYDCAVGQDNDDCFFSYDEVYRSAVDWNTTSIPDAATITNTRAQIYVSGTTAGTDFGTNTIMVRGHDMTQDWFTRSASAHYSDCAAGAMYFSAYALGPGAGLTPWIDLGASADGTVQAQLGANWFGLGLTSDQGGSRGIIAYLDWSPLEVTYNFAPPTPTLLTPANGVRTIGNSVSFTWTAVVDPDGDPVTYYLYCDTTAAPTTLIYSGAATGFVWAGPVDATTYNWRVRAYDGASFSAYSAIRWFRENGLPPMPSHSDPPNASFQQATATETTGWISGGADPDGDAVTYTWRVDVDNPPFAPYTSTGATGGVVTTTFATADATIYYWHLQAADGYETTAFTGVWSFTADGTAPAAPTLLLPTDGALITTDTPAFDWTDVADPSGVTYTIEIDGVPTGGLAVSTYTPGVPLAQGAHTWRVRATDGVGNVGPFSATFSFTIDSIAPPAPALITPADLAILATSTPAFDWTDVADPSGVTYTIDIDGVLTPGLATSDFTSGALFDGPHTWRVRAIDGAGNVGAWSATRSFTTDTQAPPAPALISPLDGAFTLPSPTLVWAPVFDATGVTYTAELDGAPTVTGATFLAVGPLADGAHSWRVRATDGLGQIGPWSATWTFTVDSIPPPAVTLIAPPDGSLTGVFPTLVWQAIAGATYDVELDGVPTPTGATSLPVGPLAAGPHAWRARATDAAGNVGPWSVVWTFTVDASAPAAPILLTPPDGSVVATNPVFFDWTDVDVAYEFEVIGQVTASPLVSDFTAALPDGAHTWRVRAVNAVGTPGPWSATFSFTKATGAETNPPTVPALISPTDTSVIGAVPVPLVWMASTDDTGVSNYEIQLDTEPTFGAPILFSASTPATTLDSPVLGPGTYFWHVRAVDVLGNQSAWCATWSFIVTAGDQPPSTPVKLLPPNGFVLPPGAVFFNWTDSTDDVGVVNYEIEVTGTVAWSAAPGVSQATSPVLPMGNYLWRVRAIDTLGQASPWSAPWAFALDPAAVVDGTPPTPPVQTSPADFSTGVDPEIDLAWAAATDPQTGVAYYLVEVFNGPLVWSAEVVGLSVTTAALPNAAYTWRVTAFNGQGLATASPTDFTHTIDTTLDTLPPGVPVKVSPLDGSTLPPGLVAFDWLPAADNGMIAYYEMQVDTDTTFATPVSFGAQLSQTDMTFALPEGVFFWRVRAVDSAGNAGGWSNFWTLTVAVTPAPVPGGGGGGGVAVAGLFGRSGDGSGGSGCTIFSLSSSRNAPAAAWMLLALAAFLLHQSRRAKRIVH